MWKTFSEDDLILTILAKLILNNSSEIFNLTTGFSNTPCGPSASLAV